MTIIIYFIIFIFAVELCELAYKNSKQYKKQNEQNFRLRIVPKRLDIVNIGSGPAYYGIDYRYCNKKGYNLATAPQNFSYGFKLLKHFSDRLSKDATVIITVMAPMSFGYNTDVYSKNYSDKYYGILSPEEIDSYSLKRKLIINHPLTFRVISKIRNIIKYKTFSKRISSRTIVQIWVDEFELINLQDSSQTERHKKTFEEKVTLLEEMITYIKENNWKPVIIIPPIPEQTRKSISHEFLNKFIYENLETLVYRVGKISIIDYYDDERFDESLFRNDIFLNEKGAEVFSKILFKDVEMGKKVI